MNQPELDKLSNREIKELWQKTVSEARQQRGVQLAQVQAQSDLGITDEEYYIDGFGNRIEGIRPVPKTSGHYINASGYVQELAPGEKAPALSGNGIVDWLNNQDIAGDPELRDALGADNLFFEEKVVIGEDDVLLNGRLESDGWHVTSRSTSPETHGLKFRLGRNLTHEQAIDQATGYVEMKAGPQFKALSENERRMIERMSVANRLEAFAFYVQSRLPDDLAEKFLELGAAGNELMIHRFAAEEHVSQIIEDGVAHTFYWNNPRATKDFFDWVRASDGGRIWTFALLDSLWNQYQTGSAINHLNPGEPTVDEILADAENMTDEELAATLTEARRLRSGRAR